MNPSAPPKKDAQRHPQSRDRRVAQTEDPAGNLDLLDDADPEPNSHGREQHQPATDGEAEDETTDEEDRNDDLALIGFGARRVKLAPCSASA